MNHNEEVRKLPRVLKNLVFPVFDYPIKMNQFITEHFKTRELICPDRCTIYLAYVQFIWHMRYLHYDSN